MRFRESTLQTVYLAPRTCSPGPLGSLAERFSEKRIPLRASILPGEGGLSADERGAVCRAKLHLLVPADASAQCGDGVAFGEKMWRIVQALKWSAHIELICEEIL